MRLFICILVMLYLSCSIISKNKECGDVILKDENDTHNQFEYVKVADKIMEKNGYNLNELKRDIYEDSTQIRIIYILSDSTKLGGGGTIVLSKKTKKIIKKIFEQ